MAEEILVKEPLTSAMIKGGEALTRQLEQDGWPLSAAFWLFEPEKNEWRLVLASPTVHSVGPKAAYDAVAKALRSLHQHYTSLKYMSVVEPDDPIAALAEVIVRRNGPEGTRVTKNVINGRFIDDLYVYAVRPTAA